ncbi:MAG: hypothetical protein NTZ18_01810 [Candidatus Komeilibacteria bacterium]|nr:hypothetical protein [Candidatus Komeilibacteria bacterium]
MPRKANFSPDAPFTVKMADIYFTAIKADSDGLRAEFNDLRSEINQKFAKQDGTLETILSIIKHIDLERKDIKAMLWEHDTRLLKLERERA